MLDIVCFFNYFKKNIFHNLNMKIIIFKLIMENILHKFIAWGSFHFCIIICEQQDLFIWL